MNTYTPLDKDLRARRLHLFMGSRCVVIVFTINVHVYEMTSEILEEYIILQFCCSP